MTFLHYFTNPFLKSSHSDSPVILYGCYRLPLVQIQFVRVQQFYNVTTLVAGKGFGVGCKQHYFINNNSSSCKVQRMLDSDTGQH